MFVDIVVETIHLWAYFWVFLLYLGAEVLIIEFFKDVKKDRQNDTDEKIHLLKLPNLNIRVQVVVR